MQLDLNITDNLNEAELFITSKHYYRRKPPKVREAEAANMPLYVLKSNTPPQIRQVLKTIYPANRADKADFVKLALGEAEEAVSQVKSSQEMIELSPQTAYIRRLQHLIAERNELSSKSMGKEPQRRVKIYKEMDSKGEGLEGIKLKG